MGSQAIQSGYIDKKKLVKRLNELYGEGQYDLKVSALEFSRDYEWFG
jgi:hypothetical protein